MAGEDRIGKAARAYVRRVASAPTMETHPFRVVTHEHGRFAIAGSYRDKPRARDAVTQLLAAHDTVWLVDLRPGGKTMRCWKPES